MSINHKLISVVADGLHDAVCPLKFYQLLHEIQLPHLECVMLRVTINGRTDVQTNKLHGKCTAGWHTDNSSTVGGAINKLWAFVHQRASLTTSNNNWLAVAKFSKFRVWDKVQEGSILIFGVTVSEFPYNNRSKEVSMSKSSSIHLAILVEHQLMTDTHTHTQTYRHRAIAYTKLA